MTFSMISLSAPTTTPSPLYVGDFESGDRSQWDYICEFQSGRFQIVTNPVRQGKYAAKFTVKNGDACNTPFERLEVAELYPNAIREVEGSDYYYAWSTLFPNDWVPVSQWGVFSQWHSPKLGGPRTTLSLYVDSNDSIYVGICAGNLESGCEYKNDIKIIDRLTKGKWNDFIVHVQWSGSNKGLVEVWHRMEDESFFEKKLTLKNTPTMQWKSGAVVPHIESKQIGLYRSSTNATQILYQDGYRIGTTFESVLYS